MVMRSEIWAIMPGELAAITGALRRYAAGESMPDLRSGEKGGTMAGAVAVLPIHGVISQRGGGLYEMLFGGKSTERIGEQFAAAMNNPGIGAIVLDIDSPGGSVAGVAELADDMAAARGRKPIVAASNTLMASAAYWIGAQADEIYASPSSQTGSIGVYGMHMDYSRAVEAAGLTPTIISAGKYKTEANEFAPLSDEGRAAWQARVDDYYSLFVAAVARGRGRSESSVRNGFGEGRVMTAQAAVEAHLADRVGTLAEAVQRAGALAKRRASARADALRLRVV